MNYTLLLFIAIYMLSCNSTQQNLNEYSHTDYRLNDLWALESINGDELDNNTIKPHIELQIINEKIYGNTGCNTISGSVTFNKKKVSIGSLNITRKICRDTIENIFVNALSNTTFNFSIHELILSLKSEEQTLTFRKID